MARHNHALISNQNSKTLRHQYFCIFVSIFCPTAWGKGFMWTIYNIRRPFPRINPTRGDCLWSSPSYTSLFHIVRELFQHFGHFCDSIVHRLDSKRVWGVVCCKRNGLVGVGRANFVKTVHIGKQGFHQSHCLLQNFTRKPFDLNFCFGNYVFRMICSILGVYSVSFILGWPHLALVAFAIFLLTKMCLDPSRTHRKPLPAKNGCCLSFVFFPVKISRTNTFEPRCFQSSIITRVVASRQNHGIPIVFDSFPPNHAANELFFADSLCAAVFRVIHFIRHFPPACRFVMRHLRYVTFLQFLDIGILQISQILHFYCERFGRKVWNSCLWFCVCLLVWGLPPPPFSHHWRYLHPCHALPISRNLLQNHNPNPANLGSILLIKPLFSLIRIFILLANFGPCCL